MNMQLTPEWKFANAIPIVLIGFFISAFIYDGLAQNLSANGKIRSTELWRTKIMKSNASQTT